MDTSKPSATVHSKLVSFLTALAQALLTIVVVLAVIFVFKGYFNQVQAQRSYSLGVTCSVISADNGAIVGAIGSSHGYYSDPVLAAFLKNRRIAPILRANHFPTEKQEIAYSKIAAKRFGGVITNAVVQSVGQKGKSFVNKNGTLNCSALKKAVVRP